MEMRSVNLLDELQEIVGHQEEEPFSKHQGVQKNNFNRFNHDLYQSIISTGHGFWAEVEDEDSQDQVSCLQAPPADEPQQPVRRRGRPKKSQKRQQQDYEFEGEQSDDIKVRLAKNKKRSKSISIKGNTKNMLPFFQRLITIYLRKHLRDEQLQQLKSNKTNMRYFEQVLLRPAYRQYLGEMFQTRYLNRAVILSSIPQQNKFIYLKKVELFENAFFRGVKLIV